MRLKFTVAYLGGPFAGWQSQKNGRGVQDFLERAFAALGYPKTRVTGAGRTDAGVHAFGQVFHVDVDSAARAPTGWVNALNAHLPPEIRVLRGARAPAGFHARFTASGKIYRYAIWQGEVLPPWEWGRAWHVRPPLDLSRMREAASLFVGRHNFSAFSAGPAERDPMRTLRRADVRGRGRRIFVTLEGEGFLYKMARMIVAALVRAGQGRIEPEELASALARGAPRQHHVAPAEGLALVRVLYSRKSGGRPGGCLSSNRAHLATQDPVEEQKQGEGRDDQHA